MKVSPVEITLGVTGLVLALIDWFNLGQIWKPKIERFAKSFSERYGALFVALSIIAFLVLYLGKSFSEMAIYVPSVEGYWPLIKIVFNILAFISYCYFGVIATCAALLTLLFYLFMLIEIMPKRSVSFLGLVSAVVSVSLWLF